MEILLLGTILILIPLLIGTFFLNRKEYMPTTFNTKTSNHLPSKTKRSEQGLFVAWTMGIISIISLFQLFAVPTILTTRNFTPVFYVWVFVIIGLCIVSCIYNRALFYNIVKEFFFSFNRIPFISILAIILIIYQVYYVTVHTHTDADDAYYISLALETLSTGKMNLFNPYNGFEAISLNARYALSSYNHFVAAISKFVSIHPTIIFHTVIPFVFTILAYVVYALIANKLFDCDKVKTGYFLFFLSILNIFGGHSVYTSSSFLLLRIWQGKAVLVSIIIPLLLYHLLNVIKNTASTLDWLRLFIINFAACAVSSMGVYLTLILLWSYAIIFFILRKNLKTIALTAICTSTNFLIFGIYIIL